ncbi:UNVERIFIED_CONTAM: hypothetical protein Sradi_3022900 [Sesamum radiatum]|uniref:Uncharacterized protein n=1 Tax=Sesamum radiatum TaxID=300843 RepID=A0AAW2S1A3_SESRA
MGDQFFMVCWALWKHRNEAVMERKIQNHSRLFEGHFATRQNMQQQFRALKFLAPSVYTDE